MNTRSSLLLGTAVLALELAACGGGPNGSYYPPPPPPAEAISVSFASVPPSTVAVGATTSLTATVVNDSANAGVSWTCLLYTSITIMNTFKFWLTCFGRPAAVLKVRPMRIGWRQSVSWRPPMLKRRTRGT